MAAQDPQQPLIDSTPIAPIRPNHVRQNSLEKHLQSRPNPQELKDRHILLDINAAPALQSAAYDLERQRASDSLKKGLEHRLNREDLVERHILPQSSAAPAIQGPQMELAKQMRKDSLNEKISHRPNPVELVKQGVLHADPTSMDESYVEKMEDEYAKREGGA